MNENPLVSVVVITYNSAKTVLETLDSIAYQTYQNIELIISDDYSTDNTVEICKEWLTNNKSRFVHTRFISALKNTGVAGNANRGYYVATGDWIKGIAGDDLLLPECIEKNVEYVKEHLDTQLIFSKIIPFGSLNYINSRFYSVFLKGYGCLQLSDREFFYLIRLNNFLPASTAFIKKKLFIDLGGFDESIPLLEDWPFWIKASWNRIHFHFMPIHTVKYRMLDSSLSIGRPSDAYIKSNILAHSYALKVQRKTNLLLWLYGCCDSLRSSSNSIISILALLGKIINPMSYYVKYLQNKSNKLSEQYNTMIDS